MSDLIDRQKLKDYVSSLSTHPLNEWDTWGVIAAIDEQPTVAAPRWVRCEEEMPKYTGRYLVWCGVNWNGEGMHGDMMIARYDRNLQRWYVEADYSLNGPICGNIRYWMPLEPPKEDA